EKTDASNCGACGNACAGAATCMGGTCVAPKCDNQSLLCLGVCVLLMKDAGNCGACGVTCATGSKCMGGSCKADNSGPGGGSSQGGD
ncbi:MAG TPA: hypothetical protein VH560_19610, partial [Polyangia bacterium]|nr:hypothetical protein [Polyangia bacterium]